MFPVEATLAKADWLDQAGHDRRRARPHRDEAEHVLALPIEAVVKETGKQFVYEGGRRREGQAEDGQDRGARSARATIARWRSSSGIKEGDKVLIKPGVVGGERIQDVMMWLEISQHRAARPCVGHKFRSLADGAQHHHRRVLDRAHVVAGAERADDARSRGIEELGGARLSVIWPKQAEREEAQAGRATRAGITVEDRDSLFARLPHVVEHSMFTALGRKDDGQPTRGSLGRTDLVGGDGDFFASLHLKLGARALLQRRGGPRATPRSASSAPRSRSEALRRRCGRPHARARRHALPRDRPARPTAITSGMNFGFDWLDFVAMPLETVAEVDPKAPRRRAVCRSRPTTPSHNDIVKRIANALLAERHHGVGRLPDLRLRRRS